VDKVIVVKDDHHIIIFDETAAMTTPDAQLRHGAAPGPAQSHTRRPKQGP